MSDEKEDQAQVAKLQAEKMKTEGSDAGSLLKVAEVLGSVGAGGLLSSAMQKAKTEIPSVGKAAVAPGKRKQPAAAIAKGKQIGKQIGKMQITSQKMLSSSVVGGDNLGNLEKMMKSLDSD